MSSLPADLVIWALLFIGTVFCGFGLMGLFLFPDTRSRMFTAFRATAIGSGMMVLAGLMYGYTLYVATGDNQYPALILRILFLALVLAAGTWIMNGIVRERTQKERAGCAEQPPAVSGPETKDGD